MKKKRLQCIASTLEGKRCLNLSIHRGRCAHHQAFGVVAPADRTSLIDLVVELDHSIEQINPPVRSGAARRALPSHHPTERELRDNPEDYVTIVLNGGTGAPVLRCANLSRRSGVRCKRCAVKGSRKCWMHGASYPSRAGAPSRVRQKQDELRILARVIGEYGL